jgi:hypothetical protein
MEFTSANRNDIQKYYINTFVKFKEHAIEKSLDPDALFFIENVDSMKVTGTCESGDPFIIWLSDEHPFVVDYVLPHKSFFQMNSYAILLERIPAKQYYRGLSSDNTQMTFLSGAAATPKKLDIGFESLKAFVKKKNFFTLSEAIADSSLNTCVLSQRMQYNRATKLIHVDHIAVARVNPKLKCVHMLKPIFKSEVEDILKNDSEKFSFTSVNIKEEKEEAVL